MADTELTGVLHLTLDKAEVDKGVKEIGEKAEAGKADEGAVAEVAKVASDAGKDFASTFAAEVEKSVTNAIIGIVRTLGKTGEALGNALRTTVFSPAAGAASGASGAASSAGAGANRQTTNNNAGAATPPAGPPPAVTATAGAGGSSDAGGGTTGGRAGASAFAGGAVEAGSGLATAGLVVAGAALAGEVLLKLGGIVKDTIGKMMEFARSLTDVSGSMAATFAVFDVQMMLLKKEIGDALAPAMRDLLTQVSALAKDVTPFLIAGFKILTGVISSLVSLIRSIPGIGLAQNIAKSISESSIQQKLIVDAGLLVAIPGITTLPGVIKGIYDIATWFKGEKEQEQPTPTFDSMTSFAQFLKDRKLDENRKAEAAKAAFRPIGERTFIQNAAGVTVGSLAPRRPLME